MSLIIYKGNQYYGSAMGLVEACGEAKAVAQREHEDTTVETPKHKVLASYTWTQGKLVAWVL